MLARCTTAALQGLEAQPVTVEVDLGPGLPALTLVGLADAAVLEARERVRSALRHSGCRVPQGRVVVNLAPADLRKEGPGFDLPVALGLLLASGQLEPASLAGVWSAGELGLDGTLRPIRGMLSIALRARACGARALLLPAANGPEAALVEGLALWPASSLSDLLGRLAGGGGDWPAPAPPAAAQGRGEGAGGDLADIQGQMLGRRALEIAAAGGHHLLLVGPPGSGKTMLARRLASLLPPLERSAALELTRIHSVAGLLPAAGQLLLQRPFRAPHHSCTGAALIGGGASPRPGELALAHHGVLFLDELAEFRPGVLDLLRQPLEEGEIRLQRARQRLRFPCAITLVAASNPCRCGWFGDPSRMCNCTEAERRRYWGRLSGPLLDRIDLQVVMRRAEADELAAPYVRADRVRAGRQEAGSGPEPEASATVAERVARAHRRMARRNPGGMGNARLPVADLRRLAQPNGEALRFWRQVLAQRQISARGGEQLLRVARTICDLSGEHEITAEAVAEALLYRSMDRQSHQA
ncbi:MAG: YifB family Mg chelatase-like AAA ATPase [Cyanobium sp. M30B3]|jgi:magnesium chelatase family protein|nr:MAG: YifB family Mg chelatase-like AAA ATPase [Cyanobium sp. M30B3]